MALALLSKNIIPGMLIKNRLKPKIIDINRACSWPIWRSPNINIIIPSLTPHPAKDIGRDIPNIDNGTSKNNAGKLIWIPNDKKIK